MLIAAEEFDRKPEPAENDFELERETLESGTHKVLELPFPTNEGAKGIEEEFPMTLP